MSTFFFGLFCSQAKEKPGNAVQADDPISFLQLSSQRGDQATENVFELSLSQALAGSRRDGETVQ